MKRGWLAALVLAMPVMAAAQMPGSGAVLSVPAATSVQTPAEALAQDADAYARQVGVSPEEALRRLVAQQETVATTDRVADIYGDRLAGLFIEHRPIYRIVVLLTGSDPVPDQTVTAGGMDVPIVYRTGYRATRAQIVAAIERHQAAIRAALPHPPGMGADPRTGELVVLANGVDAGAYDAAALKARLEALTGVPVAIRLLGAERDLQRGDPVGGGSRVVGVNPADGLRYACTSGFVVTDGTRTGIVTAAHCPDTLSEIAPGGRQTPLRFAGQWGWGFQDVQLHVGDDALKPLFYADSAKRVIRPVTSWRNRASTRAGDFVCHRGESTGYSCALVDMTDFAPAGDLCGGDCTPTWVAVEGPVCRGGDSGGPVFSGTIAFGIVKGGSYRGDRSCRFYYYMSTDYLPPGWSLLYQPAPP